MSRTVTVSDEVYARLEAEARRRGLGGVEPLIQRWADESEGRARRAQAFAVADAVRARLFAELPPMPDSTDLLREDRER
jgi:hypothetical protein